MCPHLGQLALAPRQAALQWVLDVASGHPDVPAATCASHGSWVGA
jgi:hypothetical protein